MPHAENCNTNRLRSTEPDAAVCNCTTENTMKVPREVTTMNEPTMQFFQYEHLPAHLQEVSKPFGDLAASLVDKLPRNPERTVALRKLLESKDAAVRARLFKE